MENIIEEQDDDKQPSKSLSLQCNKCKKNKPTTEFHKRNDISRGCQYFCKECYNAVININIECICGKTISKKHNYARHLKTTKHQRKTLALLH